MVEAVETKDSVVELLEKLAAEHLETLKLLGQNGKHKTD
jgi:hypothetical protein